MIDYLKNDSSHFTENKIFCEGVSQDLASYNPTINGYCGSSGFKIQFEIRSGDHHFSFQYEKYYNSQGGRVLVYPNSNYTLAIDLKRQINNHQIYLKIQKSWLKRQFMNKKIKRMVPKGYSFKTNLNLKEPSISEMFRCIGKNNIWTFTINKSSLSCKLYDRNLFPNELLSETDQLLKLCQVEGNFQKD